MNVLRAGDAPSLRAMAITKSREYSRRWMPVVVALACAATSWVVTSSVSAAEGDHIVKTQEELIPPANEGANPQSIAASEDGSRVVIGYPEHQDKGGLVSTFAWNAVAQKLEPVANDLEGSPGDELGKSVALSADGVTLAVAMPRWDSGRGKVTVHRWDPAIDSWSEPTLTVMGDGVDHLFGWSVALSADGTTLAVGAPQAGLGATTIYRESESTWTQQAQLDGGTDAFDFGWSVDLSGDGSRVAIGSPYYGAALDGYNGAVLVYQFTPGNNAWGQVGDAILGEASKGLFGSSVGLSSDGNRVVVGQPRASVTDPDNPDQVLSRAGMVHVLDEINAVWTNDGEPFLGPQASAQFGYSVAISDDGTRIAAGASSWDTPEAINTGLVEVYDRSGGTWTAHQSSPLIGTKPEGQFGRFVALTGDGNRLLATAPRVPEVVTMIIGSNDVTPVDPVTKPVPLSSGRSTAAIADHGVRMVIGTGSANNGTGLMQTLRWDPAGQAWVREGADLSGGDINDEFGRSVALSADGATVAVSSPGSDSQRGKVTVHRWDPAIDSWSEPTLTVVGEDVDNHFGWSVALSADGSTLAVGAPAAQASPADPSSGATTIYHLTESGTWEQLGQTIYGQAFSKSGSSVALSADGRRIAVGAPEHDVSVDTDSASDEGAVLVYRFNADSATWDQVGETLIGEAVNFGLSVGLSSGGTRLVVGDPEASVTNSDNPDQVVLRAGMVRVFDQVGTGWNVLGDPLVGTQEDAGFGSSVTISDDGTRIAAGAWGWDASGAEDAGRVVVADWSQRSWVETESMEGTTDSQGFGDAVAIDRTARWLASSNGFDGRVSMFFLTEAPEPEPHGFIDVPASGWRNDAVAWLKHHQITTGCSSERFCPDDPMPRAQQITFLWRYVDQPAATTANPFTDVGRDRNFTVPIDWAAETGITDGYAGTDRFGPDDLVTRGQAVTFLWRQAGRPEAETAHGFVDVADGRYFSSPVAWAKQHGITTGTSATTFSPDRPVTRAEFAAFLQRYAAIR